MSLSIFSFSFNNEHLQDNKINTKEHSSYQEKTGGELRENLALNKSPFRASIADSAKTQILVLGTPHFRILSKDFKHSSLTSLMNILEKFHPDIIGVESIPSVLLENMKHRKESFNEIINYFAKLRIEHGHTMQKILNISRHKAEYEGKKLFKEIHKNSLNIERRIELVKYLLASYDDISAILQWSYLPEKYRFNNKDFPDKIRNYLNNKLESADEKFSIGVFLAKKMNLQRVEHIDDHHDKDIYMQIASDLTNQVKNNSAYKAIANHPFYTESNKKLEEATEKDDLLSYYIYINSPEYAKKDMELQWDVWFHTRLNSGLDRSRMALWEVRNLNITSHIRRAIALHPGKRMLVIIGVGHKAFLNAYLSQMVDVALIQLRDLL